MRVLVIGGGLAGLTTAHYLMRHGIDVTVVERNAGPALETSYANAGMLTPSMCDPWNAPGVARKLLRWIGREDAPLLLRPRALPSLLGWGLHFVRNATPRRFRANMLRNLRLASYSLACLRHLREELNLHYDQQTIGTLKVFREQSSFREACANAEWLGQRGIASTVLDRNGILRLEPALHEVVDRLVGAIHYPDDETGDARRFCEALADHLAWAGVELLYGSAVESWQRHGRRIDSVSITEGPIVADAFVLAAGSYSPLLAAQLGLGLPIRPVKGYSVTLGVGDWPRRPRIAVVDDVLHAAVVPLGSRLRVAGTAEFAGYDRTVRPTRIDNLFRLLREIYPSVHARLDKAAAEPWAGLRPVSADSVPLLGPTPFENLYLNTGHGHLGWTMAAGSGRAVADSIAGRAPEIALSDYSLRRFRGRS